MLLSNPTKHGTGLQIWGNCDDLRSLYETFSKLSLYGSEKDSPYLIERDRLLSIMSYEIRHAFQGDREVEKRSDVLYYGFSTDWITYIFSLSCLRDNSSLITLDELDIVNLLLLQYHGKSSAKEYDLKGARYLDRLIEIGIKTDEYSYLIQQEILDDYFSQKANKARFREIPEYIYKLTSIYTQERKDFEANIQAEIKEYKCEISALEATRQDDFNIIW